MTVWIQPWRQRFASPWQPHSRDQCFPTRCKPRHHTVRTWAGLVQLKSAVENQLPTSAVKIRQVTYTINDHWLTLIVAWFCHLLHWICQTWWKRSFQFASSATNYYIKVVLVPFSTLHCEIVINELLHFSINCATHVCWQKKTTTNVQLAQVHVSVNTTKVRRTLKRHISCAYRSRHSLLDVVYHKLDSRALVETIAAWETDRCQVGRVATAL